jgi:hypothetical protein
VPAETFLWPLMLCAPSILPAAIFYLRHYNRTPEGKRFPFALYVTALSICAFATFWAGTGLGIEFARRKPAGNLCGLYGVFVTGPLGSLIVVTVAAWLMTLFPRQMKRIVPVALVLGLAGGAYHFRYEFFGHLLIKDLDGLLVYRLQSADVDALQRFAPTMEAQLRDLPILKDVCLDSELTSDQAIIAVDPKPTVGILPTRSITFSMVPPSKLDDAIKAIAAVKARLAIPNTFENSFGKAQSECH